MTGAARLRGGLREGMLIVCRYPLRAGWEGARAACRFAIDGVPGWSYIYVVTQERPDALDLGRKQSQIQPA
jgi:hypothetical protein